MTQRPPLIIVVIIDGIQGLGTVLGWSAARQDCGGFLVVARWPTRRQVSRRHESLLGRRIRWSGSHPGSRSRRSGQARVISIQRLRLILLHRRSDRLLSWTCRSTPFDRGRAYRRLAITVASRLGRTQRRGGLDIGFDEGSPGSIGPGVLVDHAELLPPSCGVPSQAFLGR